MARKPSHPGALLREVVLPETRLTVTELAKRCGLTRNTFSKIVNERGDITEDIAIRLSRIVGSMPQFWLNMRPSAIFGSLSRKTKMSTRILNDSELHSGCVRLVVTQ
ncbi:MAG: HigA family addiction module antidote protein [Gammaproteobacteria bacterium]|nr:HigA family addiction module antidote protein [Gammaproteobacteria bacterium]